jgi:glucose/arabinose dehydrogenase
MSTAAVKVPRRRRRVRTALASLVGLIAVLWAGSRVAGLVLPANFVQDVVASGLTLPTDIAFLPDGRLLIAEKDGVVRIVKNGSLLPTPFISITSQVNDYWDRGLVGIAVDPAFSSNGYVYLYYAYEHNAGDHTGPKTARLTRVTAVGDTASPATQVVLLGTLSGPGCGGFASGSDCIPAEGPSHLGGALKFAADGTLFVTTGDAASFTVVDDLALRSQNLNSLAGKVLRVSSTGQGLSSNPFWNGSATAARSKVWAYGLRNPFRASIHAGTGNMVVADVGWSTYEEVSVARQGANLGWPCYEGGIVQSGYQTKATCQTLYAAGPSAVEWPVTSYPHGGQTAAVAGNVFYTGSTYPAEYQGAYFFADYAQGFLRYMKLDSSGNLVDGPDDFGDELAGPVDLELGPDGNIYYVAILSGEVLRIRYGSGGGTGTQYLSDLSWTSATNGWGPPERDLSNGEQGSGDGTTLRINGVSYSKGLGVHALSDIRFPLDPSCTAFSAVVGVDDEVGNNGSVIFQVFADGVELYESPVLTGSGPAANVNVTLSGQAELRLVVGNGGDNINYDHADWANATITCGGGGGGELELAPAFDLAARTNTHSIDTAHLNADGNLDLVAANAGANVVSVWLGNGNLTFGTRQDYAVGAEPKSVAIGDLNADGRLDLVSANQGTANVSVLLSNGTGGTFAPSVPYAVCTGAHEPALGDFTGDGKVDIVVACWGGSVISRLTGVGNGTFTSRVDFPVGSTPHSIVAADFNQDGRLDAAVANQGSANVSVLLGVSGGTFAPHVTYAAQAGPHSIRTADVTGDGRLDLVTANEFANSMSLLRGNANGTFQSATNFSTGLVPKGVAIGDVDGDGLLDVISANTAGNYPTCCNPGGDTLSLHLNNGTSFDPPRTFTVGLTPFAAEIADLDNDGDRDVLSANWHSSSVSILENLGTGSGGGDTSPPVFTNVQATGVTSSGATITWTTNEPSDSQVEYGLTTAYGTTTSLQPAMVTSHSVALSGLQSSTLYHYRARSRDAAGNLGWSADATFTTTGGGGGSTVYVSDLTWTSMTNGWGPAERDQSNGEQGTGDGGPLTLAGVTYAKGLGTHAASDVRYTIPTGCTTFEASIGLDDEVGANGSVVFQVWGDTTMLYQSSTLTGSSATVPVSVSLTGRSQLRLVVTNGGDNINYDHGDWANARFTCGGGGGNTPPVPTIAAPSSSLLYSVGNTINYSGSATDAQDGSIPAASLSWVITLYHCDSGDCHSHPFLNSTGASGSFVVPDHGDENYFEIRLTATDSGGLTGTTTVQINPRTTQITLQTSPAGLTVVYGGVSGVAPMVRTTVVGSTHTISTPTPQGSNVFQSWSDGGALQHDVVVGTSPMTVTATFSGGGGGTTTYLSDLTWTSMTNGWGPVERDQSNGEQGTGDGGPLTLGGVTYAKGLGTHAASDVRYTIPTGCTTFQASIGLDDEVGANGNVVFQVWGDTTMLYQSATLTGSSATVPVSVSVSGRSQLRLVVTIGTDNHWYDHADWADARFTCGGGGGDTTPPTFSNVQATGITSSGATITWTTNEASDTQVEYGLTTAYGSTTTLQPAMVTSHSAAISGLQSNTLYHYRARSRDAAGNLGTSADGTFTTLAGGGGTTVYVSDLTWTSMTNGWGPAERDRSNGEQGAADGGTLTLAGVTFAKGLGVHAASDVRYAIPTGCTTFQASIGLDDEVGSEGSVVFQVWGDTTMLYQSGTLTGASATVPVSVSVAGRSQLRLVVTIGTDNDWFDHADWANARFTCN